MSAQWNTTHDREKERGGHDIELARSIIDEARIAHVGFVQDELPYVIPMACARYGDDLLLHGSVASRLMTGLASGLACCATITHLDGIVLARSAFHSSMNYRSLMVFGQARLVEDADEKNRAFDALVEHLMPGRLADLRTSTRKEINATHLLALPVSKFATKVRVGPPSDPKSDMDTTLWAGVVPLSITAGEPVTDPDMRHDLPPPDYLSLIGQ